MRHRGGAPGAGQADERLPRIAVSRSLRATEAEAAFERAYLAYQYCFVEFFVAHLGDMTRVFRGDLQQMLVLAVVGQSQLKAVTEALNAGLDPAQAGRICAPISASRVADSIGVPRQTVRRKLALLRDKGWIVQTPDGGWAIAPDEGAGSMRDRLAEADRRAMGRIARLFADLERLVGPSG
jgi:DNA-binding transcriptional ArsR family regulator